MPPNSVEDPYYDYDFDESKIDLDILSQLPPALDLTNSQ